MTDFAFVLNFTAPIFDLPYPLFTNVAFCLHFFFFFSIVVWGIMGIWFFSFQILVPIANGTEEMEAVMIIDILRRAKADVVVASVEDKLEILASRQAKLVADVLLDEAANRPFDLIVLPVSWGFSLLLGHNQLFSITTFCKFAGWTGRCPSIRKLRKTSEPSKEAAAIK